MCNCLTTEYDAVGQCSHWGTVVYVLVFLEIIITMYIHIDILDIFFINHSTQITIIQIYFMLHE